MCDLQQHIMVCGLSTHSLRHVNMSISDTFRDATTLEWIFIISHYSNVQSSTPSQTIPQPLYIPTCIYIHVLDCEREWMDIVLMFMCFHYQLSELLVWNMFFSNLFLRAAVLCGVDLSMILISKYIVSADRVNWWSHQTLVCDEVNHVSSGLVWAGKDRCLVCDEVMWVQGWSGQVRTDV